MKQLLVNFLQRQGFIEIASSLPEFSFCFHLETQYVNVVHLIDYKDGLYIPTDQYELLKSKIVDFFAEKNLKEIHILSLIFSNDISKAETLKGQDRFCWIIDTGTKELVTGDAAVEDFYGMKRQFLTFLENPQVLGAPLEELEPEQETQKKQSFLMSDNKDRIPFINIIIVSLNVLLFIMCTFTGNLLYNIGMLTGPQTLVTGEYYRLFTSMFLHMNVDHLVNNMMILLFLGNMVEKTAGHVRYLIIYLAAGLGGGLASIGYQSFLGITNDSLGASGAVFGLFGALLFFAIINKGKIQSLSLGRVSFVIAFSLYIGFTATNVDNAAHVGGVISGFIMALVIYVFGRIFRFGKLHQNKDK